MGKVCIGLIFAAAFLATSPVPAQVAEIKAILNGKQEVPAVITTGNGEFAAQVERDKLFYRLRYTTESPVTQAHIHVGQTNVNGGVSVFLCSNLSGAPAGTPVCPATSGLVEGSLTPADVVGPESQGVTSMERLLGAIRDGLAYVNVHTERSTSGEIRGQLRAVGAARLRFDR